MQGLTWRAGFTLTILVLLTVLGTRLWPADGEGSASLAGEPLQPDGALYRVRQAPLNADLILPVARPVGLARPANPAVPAAAGSRSPVAASTWGQADILR